MLFKAALGASISEWQPFAASGLALLPERLETLAVDLP